MNKRLIPALALAAVLAVPVYARAHEGHRHRVMGTVATRHEDQLEVKATDGTTSAIVLNEKTKILRGKTKVTPDDIKSGERVVVAATETKDKTGKLMMLATEIRLGAATAR
jgi:hypothetical protein